MQLSHVHAASAGANVLTGDAMWNKGEDVFARISVDVGKARVEENLIPSPSRTSSAYRFDSTWLSAVSLHAPTPFPSPASMTVFEPTSLSEYPFPNMASSPPPNHRKSCSLSTFIDYPLLWPDQPLNNTTIAPQGVKDIVASHDAPICHPTVFPPTLKVPAKSDPKSPPARPPRSPARPCVVSPFNLSRDVDTLLRYRSPLKVKRDSSKPTAADPTTTTRSRSKSVLASLTNGIISITRRRKSDATLKAPIDESDVPILRNCRGPPVVDTQIRR